MDMMPIQSSHIVEIGYDANTSVLRLHFNSGGIYEYDGVELNEFVGLSEASSIGGHFHKYIKPHHKARRV